MNQEAFDSLVSELNAQRQNIYDKLDWLATHKDIILSEDCRVTAYTGIEFHELTREGTLSLVKRLGGRWDKRYYESTIDYTKEENGLSIRLDSAPPPETCKLVQVEEVIPASYTPARTVTRFKLQCKETPPSDNSPSNSNDQDESSILSSPLDTAATVESPTSPADSSAPENVKCGSLKPASDETSPNKSGDGND